MGWSEDDSKVLPCTSMVQTNRQTVGINETLRRVHVTNVAVEKQ
jgi:hypothetical protein